MPHFSGILSLLFSKITTARPRIGRCSRAKLLEFCTKSSSSCHQPSCFSKGFQSRPGCRGRRDVVMAFLTVREFFCFSPDRDAEAVATRAVYP